MNCSFKENNCNSVCKQIFNSYAHTVAVMRLYLSNNNNPLLNFIQLETFLQLSIKQIGNNVDCMYAKSLILKLKNIYNYLFFLSL